MLLKAQGRHKRIYRKVDQEYYIREKFKKESEKQICRREGERIHTQSVSQFFINFCNFPLLYLIPSLGLWPMLKLDNQCILLN
jgi:hypothetical protein